MMATTVSSSPQMSSASNAPTLARRQRRQNGDRVDVALVEHSEHDVHREQRTTGLRIPFIGERRDHEGLRRALERADPSPLAAAGASFEPPRMALTAAPRDAPGARLKDTVVAGNCPMWLISVGALVLTRLV